MDGTGTLKVLYALSLAVKNVFFSRSILTIIIERNTPHD
jgi:hypothetical protein